MPESIIAVNTLAYHGYDLKTTLESISKIGAKHVELVYISSYYKDLNESFFTIKNGRRVKKLLDDFGLTSVALAAHMDLGLKDSVENFARRMEFGREFGIKIINSNATDKSNEKQFFKNIELLISICEQSDIIIGLENPGAGSNNIIGNAEEGINIIKAIGSYRVMLNYDFANTYMYSKGKLLPEKDFIDALPFIVHFHLKDVIKSEDGYYLTKIGKGIVNYDKIFNIIKDYDRPIPMSIELPLRFKWDLNYNFISEIKGKPLPIDKINAIMKESVTFIKQNLMI